MTPGRMSLSAGILIATLAAFPTTVSAFDTAPHFDITEDVLASEGFSPTAIHTVQAANFLVDFYEFMGKIPQWPLDSYCQGYASSLLKIGDAQHFDDLYPPTDVAHKWDAMLDATKSTVADKMKKTDSFGLLVLLGMSLHNVQDFYAHSNWAEGPPNGPPFGIGPLAKYGDHPTWLSMDRQDRESLYVYTRLRGDKRTHGDWDSDSIALNKDWPGRPHHTDAYICAYFATRQWVRLYRTFVNNNVMWSTMQKWPVDPSWDLYYAKKISFYGGHWGGNGGPTGLDAVTSRTAATSPYLLGDALHTYLDGRCITKNRSALRSEAENLLRTWGTMPYHGPVPVTLPSAAPESLRFVQLKVHRIDNVNADDGIAGGQLDWYSESQIGGQKYMSGLIDEHDNFNFDKSPYAPWTMTKAVPLATKDLLVGLMLMELDHDNDDVVDIDPKSGARSILFHYAPSTRQLSGDLTGPAGPKARFVSRGAGDCDCAQVTISVSDVVGRCLK
ncbi:MAG TPA: hypothetical protein VEU09_11965 [Candidatus Binatia bacterium]|nr:hypothetical protein [Candidatus Binatia bacterium]